MSNAEHMLFALLRASLHEKETETSYFEGVSEKDWGQCFQLAQSQGVMALAWDGILRLPPHLHTILFKCGTVLDKRMRYRWMET